MDMLACDWGGKAGACWECWKCEPCCGEPCNFTDGIYCAACWMCPIVSWLSGAKLMAHSMDQDCAFVNHCLPACIPFIGGLLVGITTRHNLRVKYGVGAEAGDTTGMFGDCVMICFCGPCTCCQELRSVDREAWNWVKEMKEKGFNLMVDPCMFCVKGK
eukprot:TRINITY_DN94_c0_g1_i1.p1 TRINITY_DN94_c0_g1~~TRINITY_DN94_c0_g1_i1.p1  ORF type:complete len:174 (+),score=23.78 TRINITY_DN94_c0_g1_i1:46-522(+)